MRIRVRPRRIGRSLRKRVKAQLACGFLEQHRAVRRSQRRQWIFVGARTFEDVAAGLDLAAKVAGLARRSADLFELVEVRFELFVRDAEVLQMHVVRNELLAVALFVGAAQAQVGRQCPPVMAVPVNAGTADAIAQQERAMLAIRNRCIRRHMADRHRFLGEVLEQLSADAVAQLVGDARVREVGHGVAAFATFQRQHLEASGGEFHAHDGAGPAKADKHRIDARFFDICHVVPFSPAGRRC